MMLAHDDHKPVYVKAGYAWLDKAWVDKTMDANAIGTYLEARRNSDETGQIDNVIDEAENDPSNLLHEYLTHESIDEAVRQRRRDQLRRVIHSIEIVWLDPRTNEHIRFGERAFEMLGTGGNCEDAGKYRMIPIRTLPAERPKSLPKTYRIESKPAKPTPEPEQHDALQKPQTHEPVFIPSPPPPVAMNELPEQHKRALGILKRWAESYRDNAYFAPIVAVVDSYPDPD